MSSSWAVPKAVSHFMASSNRAKRASSPSTNQDPLSYSESSTVVDYTDRLKVFVGTWNMYGRLLPIDLSTFLTKKEILQNTKPKSFSLDGSATHPYHLLVIGTQECERDISESLFYPSKEVWEKRLSDYLGSHYKLVKTETLAALHVAVFVWLPVANLVKDVQSDSIKTGWANMVGNKGAVAISVLFGSRSLIFINCHLRAHQTKLSERNANVERILNEIKMPNFKNSKNKKKSYHTVIDQFDHVFLFGDTNYRINAERPFVFDALKRGDYNTLLEYDQLSIERRTEGSPLGVFQEHPIQFPPTYKLDTIISHSSDPVIASSSSARADTQDIEDVSVSTYPLAKHSSKHVAANADIGSIPTSSFSSISAATISTSRLASATKATLQNTKAKSVKSIKRRLSKKKIPRSDLANETHLHQSDSDSSSTSLVLDSRVQLMDHPLTTLCYDSSEKQRVPSWTDRILWCDRASANQSVPPPPSSSENPTPTKKKRQPNKTFLRFARSYKKQLRRDTVCYTYDAVMHDTLLGVSDHMPVIGVFGIWFDEWTPVRQKIIRLPLKKFPTLQSTKSKEFKTGKIWWQKLFG